MTIDVNKIIGTVIREVTEPLEFWRDNGVYMGNNMRGEGYTEGMYKEPSAVEEIDDLQVPDMTLRRICRALAKRSKRPFVQMDIFRRYWDYDSEKGKSVRNNERPFMWAMLTAPRRKYLAPLIAPLELIAEKSGRGYAHTYYGGSRGGKMPDVLDVGGPTIYKYQIYNEDLVRDFVQNVLSDKDIRTKALKLPS